MSRHVLRHLAVKEGEGFDLLPGEKLVQAEYNAPHFYLVLMLEEEMDEYTVLANGTIVSTGAKRAT